jgi:hypothetical protein
MDLSRTPRRAAAAAVVLLGLFWVGAQVPAYAGITGRAATTSARTVSSGTFAVIPTVTTSGTPLPAPAALTMTVATPRAFYDAVNTGTISLVAASYNINTTYVGTGTPTVTLDACPGNSWNTTLNTCPVSIVSIGSWGAGSTAVVASTQVPVNTGDRLHLRATVTTTGVMVSAAATANVTVSSGGPRQIRAAVTTNS